MEQPQDLFGNYKYCEECKRPLPLTYKENLCPSCIEQKLFREVKEYIRENDVNEYDVAQHFHIPHMHCTRCGAPIAFGTLCAKCMRQKDVSIHSSAREDISDSRMRFIED